MTDEAHEATPNHELERQIMSYNEPKNEREWWAMHEIDRLREALQKLIQACDAGHLVEKGVGGMTLGAQLQRSVINGVSALAVEEARAALGEGKE